MLMIRFVILRLYHTYKCKKFAVLRADGDMYEGILDILYNIYEFVSIRDFVIIDEYGVRECKNTQDEFRKKFDIFEPVVDSSKTRMFWMDIERKIEIDSQWYKDCVKTRNLDESKTTCL